MPWRVRNPLFLPPQKHQSWPFCGLKNIKVPPGDAQKQRGAEKSRELALKILFAREALRAVGRGRGALRAILQLPEGTCVRLLRRLRDPASQSAEDEGCCDCSLFAAVGLSCSGRGWRPFRTAWACQWSQRSCRRSSMSCCHSSLVTVSRCGFGACCSNQLGLLPSHGLESFGCPALSCL